MSDEQQGTLTLDALLGLSGGTPAGAANVDEHALEPASDLLLDLMGAAPDPSDVPLTLETLPTLPKIPLASPIDLTRRGSEPEIESEPEPAPAPDPARASEPEVKSVPDPASKHAPDSRPVSAGGRRSDGVKCVTADQAARAKATAGSEMAPVRKGKHANGRVKERAFGGKHAMRATQETLAKPADETPSRKRVIASASAAPALEAAPTSAVATVSTPATLVAETAPEVVPAPTPEADSAPNPAPNPNPTPATTPSPRSKDSRLARLNALSRKLESEIIAASDLDEQPADASAEREFSLPEWSKGGEQASPMFEERPHSISEGMKEGMLEHCRIVRIKIAAGIVASLLLVALVLGAATQCSGPGDAGDAPQAAPVETSSSSEASDPGAGQPGRSEGQAESAGQKDAPSTPSEDRSGTVVYRYVTTDAVGNGQTVTESVHFGANGLCETSAMEVEFGGAEEAEAFAESVRRDYGSAVRVVEVDGTNVHAEIDASMNRLDREAYEDALRSSVRDLAIVKKS